MTVRIGLDFGTANTVVAHWDAGRGEALPVPLGGVERVRDAAGVLQRVVPSRIAYEPHGERRLIGARADGEGAGVFQSMKNYVAGRTADIPRRVGARRITARGAATDYLTDLMALTVLAVGAGDLEIVATAPVESFDPYRDWLVGEVAAGGGFAGTRLRVVDEASAAAAGYGARLGPGAVFCVVDFGAGTLDVSVVRVEGDGPAGPGVRTVAKAGAALGGTHIDALLAQQAAAGVPRGDAVAYNRVFRLLTSSAEDAKIALSSGADRAVIRTADGSVRHEVTRGCLDALLRDADVIGRFARVLRRALDASADHGCPAAAIDQVFLVGGSCLLPAVRDAVTLQFAPDAVRVDRPLEAVAAGAAAIAGGRELSDHVQHDYAIRHLDPATGGFAYETVVRAGTPYPTDAPVKTLTLTAVHDGQTRLGLAVFELTHATGRDADAGLELVYDPSGGVRALPVTPEQRTDRATLWLNEHSPTFLTATPPARAGEDRFRVDFHIDAQKRLTVRAYDLLRHRWAVEGLPVVRLS
ncbi:Hsp70 family protein [Streptomyces sp. NPDC051940]|uniref:Hsp70 family protein n=1 Tax=Streptomyces sp. NPDC051940 TaxID=3155675 RepID=UPI00343A6B2C